MRIAHLAGEFLGTLVLVATVVGSGIMGETLSDGNAAIALLANTAATGAMLFVLVTCLGPLSGAHLNPAVTLVFLMRREIGIAAAAGYVAVQFAGGLAGTLLAHAMFEVPLLQVSDKARAGFAQNLSEVVATFMLVMAILGTRRVRPESVPAAVALVIVAGYWFTASTSFANPAVTAARALTDSFSGIGWGNVPAFVASQLLGGLLGWFVASLLFGDGSENVSPGS